MSKIEFSPDRKFGWWMPAIEDIKVIERSDGEYPYVEERRFHLSLTPDDCFDLLVKWFIDVNGKAADFDDKRMILPPVRIESRAVSSQIAVDEVTSLLLLAVGRLKDAGASAVVLVLHPSDCMVIEEGNQWLAECVCGLAGCIKDNV